MLGANGSGKSTLVRAMIGLVPLCRGEVRLFGTPLDGFRDWQRVGFVPQRVSAASRRARLGARGRRLRPAVAAPAVRCRSAARTAAAIETAIDGGRPAATRPATASRRCPAASSSGC